MTARVRDGHEAGGPPGHVAPGTVAAAGHDAAVALFAGPGEVRALARTLDWGATPLGWPDTWSPALRIAVHAMLDAPHPICLWSGPEYALVYNDAYRRILAAKHPAALGQPGSVVWAEIWERLAPQFAQVWAGGPPVYGEDARFVMARLEGGATEDAWFSYSLSALRDEPGQMVAVLNISPETTARVRAEQALEAERARLAEVVRLAPAFMAVLRGPDHVITLTNAGYEAIAGGRPVLGRTVAEALPEAAAQGFVALLDRVLATGEPYVGREMPYRRPDAAGVEDERYVDFVYQALAEPDGTRSGVFVHGIDVTDQVRARRDVERLLAESERARARTAALQDVTAALAEARTLDDVAAVVVGPMAAAAGARAGSLAVPTPDGDALWQAGVFGFPDGVRPAIRVQSLTMASPIPEAYRTGTPIWATSRDGPEGMDARYPAAAAAWTAAGIGSGAYLPLAVAGETAGVIAYAFAEPRAFAEPERAFLLALARQVAVAVERARLWAAERAAREDAERANRSKAEFLATMSHELRTPLNAIGGYAELLELGVHGPVTATQVGALGRIQRAQRHLLGLINGVLNYAKVDAGAVHYALADVPLDEVLRACEALVAPQARAKGLRCAYAGCDAALRARADPEKVQQIVLNLLSNAVKFTESGGRVTLACSAAGAGASPAVRVTVADTGVGIAADQLARVFEPFVQVDQRLTRTQEGTGLGLAISRDLARGMGGDLTAESTPGVGSTFTLTLPGV